MAAAVTISAGSPFNPFGRAWRAYERSLRRRPILTQGVSSALLWGLGDGMAQRIEHGGREGVDGRRVALTAAFGGAVIGPAGHLWYQLLESLVLRLGLACSMKSMLLKVAVDNLLYSPCYVLAFFAYGCMAIDGLSAEVFASKLRSEFVPTMLAEALVWPPYMAWVFSKVPVQHQLLAVNVATLFDVCFLSWSRTRQSQTQAQAQDRAQGQGQRSGEQQQPQQAAGTGPSRRRGRRQERQRGEATAATNGATGGNASGAGAGWPAGHDWLTYGVQAPPLPAQAQPLSGGEAMRRELAACLWDSPPEQSLGRRALMAASATCSTAGSGGGIFW